ncbi:MULTISPECIES: hypothetical protein [Planktothrix]|jgi:hypothetical protein|uniref:Uncharacterized protein n=3 Tax=Planktothrix TaxID=54304 RepID=A0A1J1JL41_PLAAG|nr:MULTISPECIES: hypothetical protein [Planktothrix]MCF3581811.1 hypothetical protein [Planktothrix agardhii 1811]MCF3605625.1 hypothetical protein [Planktothrix agardhii 1033]CAD5979041.1 hypothetical protein NO108_04784 [Planktothrix rubescens]BBD53485.1 hypothetical protein NIES204_07590 [Planktothrix agardhii NIES-204]MBG0746003.1 hypothetical protein [Planktothrix agardhii KL2]
MLYQYIIYANIINSQTMAIIKSRLLLSLSLLTTLISLSLPVKADSTAEMNLINCQFNL